MVSNGLTADVRARFGRHSRRWYVSVVLPDMTLGYFCRFVFL